VRKRTAGLWQDGPAVRVFALVLVGFSALDHLRQLDQPDSERPRDTTDRPPLRRAAPQLDLAQGSGGDASIERDIFLAAFWLSQAQFAQDRAKRKVRSIGRC
jgi:hypothetical protein